jgi:hypothetical protein
MFIKKQFIFLFLFVFLVFSLAGCGSNLFSGLAGSPSEENPTKLLEQGNYNKALEKANEVLDAVTPSSDPTPVQEALVVKGEAILGQKNITAPKIFEDFTALAESSDSSSEPSQNIFDVLETTVKDASIEDLSSAADSLNSADAVAAYIAAASPRIQAMTSAPPNLNANQQILRGIANTLIVIKIVNTVIDVNSEGDITINATLIPQTFANALDKMMNPTGANHSVVYYGNKALDAFTAADAFSAKQLEEITKIKTAGTHIESLNTVVEHPTNTNWTFQGTTYNTSIDSQIGEALKAIFKSLTSS